MQIISFSEFLDEREAIEYYFHFGYNYDVIRDLLELHHGITMSVRTLKRRLQGYNLARKDREIDEDVLMNIIRDEMQGPGQLVGYRRMWHILKMKYHLHMPRSLVAKIIQQLDPDASKARKQRRLQRRKYFSHGPNNCWHIDGKIHLRISNIINVENL